MEQPPLQLLQRTLLLQALQHDHYPVPAVTLARALDQVAALATTTKDPDLLALAHYLLLQGGRESPPRHSGVAGDEATAGNPAWAGRPGCLPAADW